MLLKQIKTGFSEPNLSQRTITIKLNKTGPIFLSGPFNMKLKDIYVGGHIHTFLIHDVNNLVTSFTLLVIV